MAASESTSDGVDQESVFAFLSDAQTHRGSSVQRIDTHAASVFLAGSRALKVKRAVKFPFLDYSTLEKRKEACDQEIAINRLFAPQIYRGVVAITKKPDGGLEIAGQGPVAEWAVDMVRFDESKTLDRLASAGSVNRKLAEDTADSIVRAHEKAAAHKHSSWVQSIPSLIAANSEAFSGHYDSQSIDELDRESLAVFERVHDLLRQRESKGLVRRCHGDLHLANIALIEGKPALFDAIEFDPAIATTDVLYDLAFPVMDLLHYEQSDAANTLLNCYLQSTPSDNLDGLSALPLFMSIRAAVRSHVLLARQDRDPATREAATRSALAYFSLARGLIKPAPPKLIAVGGLSGTGKSTLARNLAPFVEPLPGAIVLRSDVIRKRHFGAADIDKLPGEAYRPEIAQLIYKQLVERAKRILSQGYSVIIDAVFSRENERSDSAALAAKCNVPFCGLFLTADVATRMKRVDIRPPDASDATSEVVLKQESYDLGHIDWHLVDASATPEKTLARARAVLDDSV
ncbi:aminoglycoside phosphotransferase family enzyme/predicted kinase [Nitrobacteraceae bacterium AZCC 1564]